MGAKREKAVNSAFQHPNGSVYLSFSEVARRTGVRTATVRTWIAKGLLRTFLVLGRQMIREDDLQGFMEPEELGKGVVLKNAVAEAE